MTAPIRSQEVIDKWSALVAARASDVRNSWLLAGVIVLGMAALAIWPSGWLFALTAFAGLCFVINQVVIRGSTFCPNCGNAPLGSFDRSWTTDAKFCIHCNYLLQE